MDSEVVTSLKTSHSAEAILESIQRHIIEDICNFQWKGKSFCVGFLGAVGARRVGCRPHLCGKKPRRAQQHTHCDWRADEQPAGGTQLRGSRIPPPFANTGVCAVMVFVTRLHFLSSRLKSLPTSRAVTLRRWPSWRTNTANYWSVSAQRGLWLCLCVFEFLYTSLFPQLTQHPQLIPLQHDTNLHLRSVFSCCP